MWLPRALEKVRACIANPTPLLPHESNPLFHINPPTDLQEQGQRRHNNVPPTNQHVCFARVFGFSPDIVLPFTIQGHVSHIQSIVQIMLLRSK